MPGITLRTLAADRTSSYHLFPVLTERRDDLIKKLHESDIGAGVHYWRNDDYTMFAHADLPNTDCFFIERALASAAPTSDGRRQRSRLRDDWRRVVAQ